MPELRQERGYLSCFFGFFAVGFGATCGIGGVLNIFRSTSLSKGVGDGFFVMDGV
jgi:hypothetical protein